MPVIILSDITLPDTADEPADTAAFTKFGRQPSVCFSTRSHTGIMRLIDQYDIKRVLVDLLGSDGWLFAHG